MKDHRNFILPKEIVTVDLEVMTLTGVHVYNKDKNDIEKHFPWSEENMPPPEFLKKVKRPQDKRKMNF